ncbi:MAG: DNA pilot protein [Arizlama microvirus]|nr:MAG: DNA pilot protein [Arizlama microvirus]
MVPIVAASLLSGAAATGQGILGIMQNRQNQKFAEKQTNQARSWALEDWRSQNEYNSPRSQMQRLQEAGLNPNLVYGTGAATAQAQPVRPTQPQSYRGETPNFSGLQNSIFAGVDMQQRKAQIDLLEKQGTIAIQTAALQAAKTGETLAKTAKSQFDLNMANSLKNISLQTAEENLKKLQIGNTFQLSENERRNALTAGNLAQAAERILLMRAQTANTTEQGNQIRATIRSIKLDGDLKQLDKDLREKGIYPNSPWWLKTLETYLDGKTNDKPFGGDLDFIPKSPAGKPGSGKTGYPNNANTQNWYKWK